MKLNYRNERNAKFISSYYNLSPEKKDWFKSELLKGSYAIYQNGVLITTSANLEVIHIADTYFQVNNKKYAYNDIEIKR